MKPCSARLTLYDRESFQRIVAIADGENVKKRWRYFLQNIKYDTIELSAVILEPVFVTMINEKNMDNFEYGIKHNGMNNKHLLSFKIN